MEYTACHPLLQFTEQEMALCRKEVGMSDPAQLRRDIDSILDWFQKQPHLVHAGIERDTVERMMLQAKGSIERTKERIERLYTLRGTYPELMTTRDTHDEHLDRFWSWSRTVAMPRLYAGRRITLMQFTDRDSSTFDYTMLYRIGFMVGDFRLKHDYSVGDIYIVDLANTTFGHLAKVNPYTMRKAEALFQEGYGSRICSIHILNAPAFADKLLYLVKQTIKPKITSRIVIHSSLEDLHRAVPREHLPSDYGGLQKSMEHLGEMWRQEFRSEDTRRFFLESERRLADEALRVGGTTPPSDQLAGSFRKLQLD